MSSLAFIFPGQGSQSVGMLAAAHSAWPVVADTFTEASDTLGIDLWSMACQGPEETLALTANTQPLILTASISLFRAWQHAGGPTPGIVGGHSLGEFSALVSAGALAFPDAVGIVRKRGEAMQEAVPVGVGAMAAIIGLDDETINAVCDELSRGADHLVCAVNFNSPGQVVIAGHAKAVEQASSALKEAGAKRALPLPVSAPFHTPLMHYAGEVLRDVLDVTEIKTPAMPVVSNVHGQAQTDASVIKELMVQQVSAPVQWTRCMNTMREAGTDTFIECGPGKVLSGLLRRIDKSAAAHTIETPELMQASLDQMASMP